MTTADRSDELVHWYADDMAAQAASVHRGQARIAYRVAGRFSGQQLHVHGLGWHVWDGTRFVLDERGQAKRNVLDELRCALGESLDDKELRNDVRRCESASGVSGVLDLAGALEPFAAAAADLDADPYVLNVANGTLDLRTLDLRAHNPQDRITKVCRAGYYPDAKSELWQSFLARVLPDDEVRGFVQRLVGVGLLGTVIEHVLPIWTGTGANGKSVLNEALRHALGDYAMTAEPELLMHRDGAHPTGEMDVRGCRWVVVSESDRGRRLAESTVKRLTGGDSIRARRMRQDFVEFVPSHTALLVTNHLPQVAGDDPAIWRRIRVVPFDVTIPETERDGHLGEKLQLEADGILGWAIEGYRQYTERGLDEPAAVTARTDAYQLASDAVGRFVAECCSTAPTLKAETSQLFERWERWRIADGAEALTLKAFGQALDRKGFPAQKSTGGRRFRNGVGLLIQGES